MYFYFEPEVAGGLGERTVLSTEAHPPIVQRLHYELDGWLGSDFLEAFPCFIVTEVAKRHLSGAVLTGIDFGEVEVTVSTQFRDLYPNRAIPAFCWLRVHGMAGIDDFGLASDGRLVVSATGMEVLRGLEISRAVVTVFS